MYRFLCVVLLLSAMVMLSNCSNITMLRTKELRGVQERVDSLHSELTTMQKKIYEEQLDQGEMLRLLRADQQLRFSEINRKVSDVSGNLSESQYRLTKIDEKNAAFQKKFEAKLDADSIAGSEKQQEIDKLFQIALADFNAGRYSVAKRGFFDIVNQYPDNPVIADVEYWQAECHYAQKEYVDAEQGYIAYVKKYPDGAKLCAALYKLGLTYDKQGKKKSKQMVWKKAVEQCKDAPEVELIKAQLR